MHHVFSLPFREPNKFYSKWKFTRQKDNQYLIQSMVQDKSGKNYFVNVNVSNMECLQPQVIEEFLQATSNLVPGPNNTLFFVESVQYPYISYAIYSVPSQGLTLAFVGFEMQITGTGSTTVPITR